MFRTKNNINNRARPPYKGNVPGFFFVTLMPSCFISNQILDISVMMIYICITCYARFDPNQKKQQLFYLIYIFFLDFFLQNKNINISVYVIN